MHVDTTYDLVQEGMSILKKGDKASINAYLQSLKRDDPLAWAILDASLALNQSSLPEAIRKLTRLLPKVSGDLRLSVLLLRHIGLAHMRMGELSVAEIYYTRAMEIAEKLGETRDIALIKVNFLFSILARAEYETLCREIGGFDLEGVSLPGLRYDLNYMLADIELARGKPDRALKKLDYLDEPGLPEPYLSAGIETRGLAMRMMARLEEARECFVASAQGFGNFGHAYAPFPCAKALQLSRFAGLEPPPKALIRKCLSLAKKGSWGELAAAQEIEALILEDDKTCAEALFSAAQAYSRANQPLEACLTGLHTAYIAWRTSSPVFPDVLKFLSSLLPLYPGFKKDPILGDFAIRLEPLIATEPRTDENRGIRAYLIGELRIFANGKRVSLKGWRNNKAILALVHLLVSPQHRIAVDHLFYLLWPRRNFNPRNTVLLYKAIYLIRQAIGDRALLTKRHDFYQLEDTWTDLGEIENLMRLADATRDPDQREEYLRRARELAKAELLPEFPYDRHIDEYRQYYERLRKRLFGKLE